MKSPTKLTLIVNVEQFVPKVLTFGLHGKLNDANRVDIGGGSALGIVPVVCMRPRRL